MKGEILDIETVQEMAKNEKKLERLKRDKNLAEEKLKILQKKYDALEQRNNYAEQVNRILETTEAYLPHRIKQIEDTKDSRYGIAVLELQRLADSIRISRNKIDNKEVEEDEE